MCREFNEISTYCRKARLQGEHFTFCLIINTKRVSDIFGQKTISLYEFIIYFGVFYISYT